VALRVKRPGAATRGGVSALPHDAGAPSRATTKRTDRIPRLQPKILARSPPPCCFDRPSLAARAQGVRISDLSRWMQEADGAISRIKAVFERLAILRLLYRVNQPGIRDQNGVGARGRVGTGEGGGWHAHRISAIVRARGLGSSITPYLQTGRADPRRGPLSLSAEREGQGRVIRQSYTGGRRGARGARRASARISAFVFRAISTEAATGRAAMVQAFGRMSHVASVEPKQSQALYPFQVAPARSAAGIRSGLFTIAPSFALPSAAPQETGSILECALLK
jgi:hypothetical protein